MPLGSAYEVKNDGKGLDIDNRLVIKVLIIAPPYFGSYGGAENTAPTLLFIKGNFRPPKGIDN